MGHRKDKTTRSWYTSWLALEETLRAEKPGIWTQTNSSWNSSNTGLLRRWDETRNAKAWAGCGGPVHSSAVFTYQEGAHRQPPRDVKRLTRGHRASEGTSESRGQAPGPLPSVTRGPAARLRCVRRKRRVSFDPAVCLVAAVWLHDWGFGLLEWRPLSLGKLLFQREMLKTHFFPLGFKEGKHDLIH